MDVREQKRAIRREMRLRRRQVAAAERADYGRALSNRLLNNHARLGTVLAAHGTIAVYLASPDEIDLGDFIAGARARGCRVVAPRWNGRDYELVALNEAGLVKGPHDILEPPPGPIVPPRAVDAWLVPGLAFTRDGRRLGYGGGWYDRLLATASPTALALGIAYPFQIVADLPNEAHDCRLNESVVLIK